jgi:hypothetical protein
MKTNSELAAAYRKKRSIKQGRKRRSRPFGVEIHADETHIAWRATGTVNVHLRAHSHADAPICCGEKSSPLYKTLRAPVNISSAMQLQGSRNSNESAAATIVVRTIKLSKATLMPQSTRT